MTKPKLKRGEIVGEESGKYLWTICLNQEMKAWTGPVTVTDTIGDGHKLTKYLLINSINQNNGSYGVDNTPYFQIYEYDWNKMRDDYNDLFGDDSNHSGDTVSHDKYANGYVYQRYKTATDSNGNVSYDIPDGVVTTYMYTAMRGAYVSGSGYLYRQPYTGNVGIILTANGFELVFPGDDLNGKSLLLKYYTELTAKAEQKELINDILLSGANSDDDGGAQGATKLGTVAFVKGTSGKITLYKSNQNETTFLGNAIFQLTNFDGESLTGTTDSGGNLVFSLTDSVFTAAPGGIYTLTELTPPTGYLAPDNPIELEVDAGTLKITTVNGIPVGTDGAKVSGICKVDPDGLVMNIYNTPEPIPVPVPASVTLQLTGKKTLSGKMLTDDMFSFVVLDANGNIKATANSKADGTITFSDIAFSQTGTYTYTVSEINGGISGYTYDSTKYTVVVQVNDIGGVLAITSLSVDGVNCAVSDLNDIIKFNNKYTTGGGGSGGGGGGSSSGGCGSSSGGDSGPGTDNTTPDNSQNLPPVSEGHTLVTSGDNQYVEIDTNGVLQGTWHFDEDTQTWIFEPIPVLLSGLAKTGESSSTLILLLLSLGAGFILIVMIMKKRFRD